MDQNTLIYKFLLSPRYRAWRYTVLIAFFSVFSVNLAFYFGDFAYLSWGDTTGIIIGMLVMYVSGAFAISRIASNYLLSGRYLHFFLSIAICAIVFTAGSETIFAFYTTDYNLFSESEIVNIISNLALYILCITGIIIPVVLKKWALSNQHLNQLKMRQASSQVEQFKEQINPPSFFKILDKSKNSVKTDPDKASLMLMKLAQLLRYQLYDCNRHEVLVTAEISFLRNFLELEKLCSQNFYYSIENAGNMNGIFIKPSVILPYVQCVLNAFDGHTELQTIAVTLSNDEHWVSVTLDASDIGDGELLREELSKLSARLDTLYKDNYELIVTASGKAGKAEMTLTLARG